MTESDEDLRKIMSNFNQDKQELEAKIKEKRAELEQVEANHRGLRTRHGKEAQRLGELNANRKVRHPERMFRRYHTDNRSSAIRPQCK
jgi:predicted RNase H-like nuclease (RuvC/YqgF family)